MIKVAHVIYSFGIGGLEKGITTLINHGSDDIEHVIISLCGKKDSETLLCRSARIICLDKQGGNSLRFIWVLAKVIRSVRPDVVHTRNWSGMDEILAARLNAIKNHGALIAAVNQVAAARPAVTLVAVGDGPEAAALKARAGDNVRFLGYRSDTARLMLGFDLFVLPSFSDSLTARLIRPASPSFFICSAWYLCCMPAAVSSKGLQHSVAPVPTLISHPPSPHQKPIDLVNPI